MISLEWMYISEITCRDKEHSRNEMNLLDYRTMKRKKMCSVKKLVANVEQN